MTSLIKFEIFQTTTIDIKEHREKIQRQSAVYQRSLLDSCRWEDRGKWENFLKFLPMNPILNRLMIDAGHIKVHSHDSEEKVAIRIWPVQQPQNTYLTARNMTAATV